MDVVPAERRDGARLFSGASRTGPWGRGAEDMKAEGILQLLALIRLKREGVPLDRDVIFLGTADEEVDFLGALRVLSPEGWAARIQGAEFFVTEGGENLRGPDGKPVYFGVETGEKGVFWLKVRTTGTPGHGSRPIEDSAMKSMVKRPRAGAPDARLTCPAPCGVLPRQAARPAGHGSGQGIATAIQDPAVGRVLYRRPRGRRAPHTSRHGGACGLPDQSDPGKAKRGGRGAGPARTT